ncbi:MAG: hypothetical protein ACREEB_00450 [Caulobacteraceae bacterium]
MIDPVRCNVSVDASGLSRPVGDAIRAGQVDRLLKLHADGILHLILPHGVWDELHRAGTPSPKRTAANEMIFTIKTGLTTDEQRRRQVIKTALQGNAKPGKHDADAEHLAEAAKYGGYFITHDERILKLSPALRDALGPALQVVTLADFLAIYDGFRGPEQVPDLTVGDLDRQPASEELREREDERVRCIAAIEISIDAVEAGKREPDRWERYYLANAIANLSRGAYGLGVVGAELALTPPANRARDPGEADQPVYDGFDIGSLRRALRETAAGPLRRRPQLGPIVFTGADRT